MYPDKFVNKPEDIPTTEHFAIIEGDSVTIPGDERSRTNPGHGYPESTNHYIKYEVYFTEEKLLQAVRELEEHKFGYKKSFKVLKVTPMTVKKNVSVSVV